MSEIEHKDIFDEREKARESGQLFKNIVSSLAADPAIQEKWTKFAEEAKPFVEQLSRIFENMQREWAPVIRQFQSGMEKIGEAIAPYVIAMQEAARQAELLEKAGWLPHYTFPFALFESKAAKSCFCWKSGGGKRGFGLVMFALCAWQNRFSDADEVQQAA